MTTTELERAAVMPIPAPCSCYPDGVRCQRQATVWLVHPDGTLNPGGYTCREHGDSIVAEYAEKLRERWSLTQIRRG